MSQESLPPDLREFIRNKIRSVWALEALLLLRNGGQRTWTVDQLTRELRSSDLAVTEVVMHFRQTGLLIEDDEGYRYSPTLADEDGVVARLGELYAQAPMALINEIANSPGSKIKDFADAFRLKKE